MLSELTVKEFLKAAASSTPIPGGGSAAALAAALAAGLSEMVAGLTVGRKGFEEFEEEMTEIAASAATFRDRCSENIDRDAEAYNQVIAAFRMPKDNDEEKKARSEAIQIALKHAALVPLETARLAFQIVELAGKVVQNGNPNAVTDGVVAAMLARTAVLAGLYNVKINLTSINDSDFVTDLSKQVDQLEEVTSRKEKEILSHADII